MPRKKKANSQMGQLVAAFNAVNMTPRKAAGKKKRKRRAKGPVDGGLGQQGVLTFSRDELFCELKLPANKSASGASVTLHPDNFPFLKSLSKSFDQIVWRNVKFVYKPAVGTNWGGLVTLGFDWDFSASNAPDRKYVSALTPNLTTSAWGDTSKSPMVLPTSRLQTRKFYVLAGGATAVDQGPGKFCWAVSGQSSSSEQTVGEVWVSYSVQMLGTQVPT